MKEKTFPIKIRAIKGKSIIDRLIQWRTGSIYNHVEFLYPVNGFDPSNARPYRNSIRALGAQPAGGIQIRPLDYLGNVAYDVYQIDLTISQIYLLNAYVNICINAPYDWSDILQDALNITLKTTNRAYDCSEFVAKALAYADAPIVNRSAMREASRITPGDVCKSVAFKWVDA